MNKNLVGIIFIIGIAVSWCSCKQYTFMMQTFYNFKATFFIMWYQTGFISFSIFYPILTCQSIKKSLKNDKIGFEKLIKMGFIFYILWLISNYLAILSLKNISSSLFVAVFSVSPAFVYVLSKFVLNERFTVIKSLAVVSAVLGVVLIGISQKIIDGNIIGVLFSILSALFAAFYVVFLKKLIGFTTVATATTLLTVIGLINTVLFWPIFIILNHYELETISWFEIPWGYLNISAVTGFLFNAFVNIGIAYTYPLFISIGTILGIPANLFVDAVIHGFVITPLHIAGSCLVIVAFCLLVVSGLINGKKKEEVDANEPLLPGANNRDNKEKLNSDIQKKVQHFSLETI